MNERDLHDAIDTLSPGEASALLTLAFTSVALSHGDPIARASKVARPLLHAVVAALLRPRTPSAALPRGPLERASWGDVAGSLADEAERLDGRRDEP